MDDEGRRPCLAEEFFVEDGLLAMRENPAIAFLLKHINSHPTLALRECYRMSRAIRVKRVLANKLEAGRRTSDWEALEVLAFIGQSIGIAVPQVLADVLRVSADARH